MGMNDLSVFLGRFLPSRGDARMLKKFEDAVPELNAADTAAIQIVQPYTMTSKIRRYELLKAVRYVNSRGIPGDFVECGVWRGGSTFLMRIANTRHPGPQRSFWLYDTFAGMPAPVEKDGRRAFEEIAHAEAKGEKWICASRADVEAGAMRVLGDLNSLRFVEGKVEDTLQVAINLPDRIAILRLDTDFYESTKIELEILYPRLMPGGVLVIDDYGSWPGSRAAVDEYFAGQAVFLHYVDRACRIIVKT
jgi:hypothetical protein